VKIYTRTGDDGTTGLFGGARVAKESLRVTAYGTVDELNACLGVARAAIPERDLGDVLIALQRDLFTLGAELGCAPGKTAKLPMALLGDADVSRLERHIDDADALLASLTNFVLPGGSAGAAALHFARTVCRRAERDVLSLAKTEAVRSEVLVYLNRLSDLLFALALRVNAAHGVAETPWAPRSEP
jgi:cob(I)alamin adenosyltransferase